MIDVGQGDCTFIETPMHQTILIDGGGSESSSFDVGEQTLLPYLLDKGYTKMDYVFISHFDHDHVGGILTILDELKVGQVVFPEQIENSDNYQKFIEIVKEKQIQVKKVKKGDVVIIEKDLSFEVLWPVEEQIEENILNNNSMVTKLKYKNFSMLFTGDIEKIAELQILEIVNNDLLREDILKVAHHGSKTSTSKEFLEAIRPSIALIGVGENNNFGHPNYEVIERLKNVRCKYL